MPRPRNDSLALAAVCLTALMFGLEISSVPVTLPTVRRELGGSFAEVSWVMNAYTLAVASVLMPAGALADRFGRKRLLAGAIVAFGLASLLCGLAASAPALIAARALQGAAGGAMLSCQIAVLSHQFAGGERRARAFGVWGVVFGVGLGFGPLAGGLLIDIASWRWVYLVQVTVAPAAFALLLAGARESRDPRAPRVDVAGMATLAPGVVGVVVWITEAPDLGFGSLPALAILATAAALLTAFVIVERTRRDPMIDFGVFGIRPFTGAVLGSAGMNFGFWPLIVYLPIHLETDLGYSAAAASTILLAYTLPTLVLPPIGERLALRYQPSVVIPLGLCTIGVGILALRLGGAVAEPSWVTLAPGLLLAGVGLGLTNTPVTNTTTASVPSSRAGMASGIDMSARMTSLTINISIMGLLLSSDGFGAVTLYGGIAVLVFAVASRVVFTRACACGSAASAQCT
jgi:EmrB/QacA subfamily drug resistance transporter